MTNPAEIVSNAIRTSQELGVQVGLDTSEAGLGVLNELHTAATDCEAISDSETLFRGEGWKIHLRVTQSSKPASYAVVIHYCGVDRIVICKAKDSDEAFEKARSFVVSRKWHSASVRSVAFATRQDINAAEHTL